MPTDVETKPDFSHFFENPVSQPSAAWRVLVEEFKGSTVPTDVDTLFQKPYVLQFRKVLFPKRRLLGGRSKKTKKATEID